MPIQTYPSRPFSLRPQIAKEWTRFSEEELDNIGNNARRLIMALQDKYGLSEAEAERQVRSLVCRAWNEHRLEEWLAG